MKEAGCVSRYLQSLELRLNELSESLSEQSSLATCPISEGERWETASKKEGLSVTVTSMRFCTSTFCQVVNHKSCNFAAR